MQQRTNKGTATSHASIRRLATIEIYCAKKEELQRLVEQPTQVFKELVSWDKIVGKCTPKDMYAQSPASAALSDPSLGKVDNQWGSGCEGNIPGSLQIRLMDMIK
jgi:hypothetical protein